MKDAILEEGRLKKIRMMYKKFSKSQEMRTRPQTEVESMAYM